MYCKQEPDETSKVKRHDIFDKKGDRVTVILVQNVKVYILVFHRHG